MMWWRIIVLCGLSLVASCARSDGLAGKWQMSGQQNVVWEFTSNGGLNQAGTGGKYSFGDNQRLKIETPFATSVYQMQVTGDQLTLTDARGSKLTFRRVKDQ